MFVYVPEFVTVSEEKELIEFLKAQEWRQTRSRRMLTYGWKYEKGDFDQPLRKVEPIPELILSLVEKLSVKFAVSFNQVTVNEYLPGQGIDAHYDHPTRFGPVIAGLSLNSATTMQFEHEKKTVHSQLLKPRSVYMMTGDYRYKYQHRIKGLASDYDPELNTNIPRTIRYSITVRRVVE